MIEFKLPSLGADMDEGTLVEWRIKPGQTVRKGDVVAVVDTTKAAVDVESWVEGTVHQLVTEPGETIAVGTVMAWLLAPGEAAPAALPAAAAPAPRADARALPETPPAAPLAPAVSRTRVSPAARRRAEQLGIDPLAVKGTGPEGAVTLQDVEALAGAQTTNPPAAAPSPKDRAAEMRRAIAAAMVRSKREIPHYYLSEAVPVRSALAWLAARNATRPVTERLLPAVLLLKAVAVTLRRYPELNGHFVDGGFQPAAAVHLGVAISLRQGGLIAPALHDVDAKPLDTLMPELADLVKRCRAGSLRSSEMSDATVTVTNLGDAGVETVFGVIYPPQVALVGLGRIADRPCVENGAVVAMPALTASLAADHRVSDGHRGALFLAELREVLQHPEALAGDAS
jgi:pyruvate dehydrogenase E2 component (dihydrolipoamide acetyltransferase)